MNIKQLFCDHRKQLFCDHRWESVRSKDFALDTKPSYYCHVLSVFAHPHSYLGKRYLVWWWLKCSKCGKRSLEKWFVCGDGKGRELCPNCRLYVSTYEERQWRRGSVGMREITVLYHYAKCDNCGVETYNPERDAEMSRISWHTYTTCCEADKPR